MFNFYLGLPCVLVCPCMCKRYECCCVLSCVFKYRYPYQQKHCSQGTSERVRSCHRQVWSEDCCYKCWGR